MLVVCLYVCICVRPYVVNLLPCLLRICQRSEEMVHETLAAAMSKISPILISFMTDMETKVVLCDCCGVITLYCYYSLWYYITLCDYICALYFSFSYIYICY